MADSESHWTDCDSEFQMDPEREAELKALHDQIVRRQTVHDRNVANRFYQILDKVGTPTIWKTLVRYPRIDGKNYMDRDLENPPQVALWTPGHEIQKRVDHLLWACMYVETYPKPEMYLHHSVEVYRDGRLIGTSHGTFDSRIDVQELNSVLDLWSEELRGNANAYWDKVYELD